MVESMIKVFDFDKTLTYVDTSMMFLLHCCRKYRYGVLKSAVLYFYAICYKLKIIDNHHTKGFPIALS